MLTRRGFLGTTAAAAALTPQAVLAAAPLNVVATTGMIADTARRIGGEAVTVTGLLGAGVDPHSYRQTRSDIVTMTRADLTLWHGLYLEAQMEEFLLRLGGRSPVVAVTDRMEAAPDGRLIGSEDYETRFDPHIWMDPALWTQVAARIRDAFTKARPDAAEDFAARTDAFTEELSRLRTYGAEALSQIPTERRVLLTAHDAFAYFGRAFDMEVIGVQGISTDNEAGLHRIRELVDMIVLRGIDAVFVETSVSDRNMRALIEGAAARGHKVRLGGALFSDAMGEDGTYEGTYVGMIDHNITTIARALGVDVPQTGLNGKLGLAA